MKGLWKKRLKKALQDGDNWGALFTGTFVIGGFIALLGCAIVNIIGILALLGLSFGLGFLTIVSIFLYAEVLGQTSPHDKEIAQEEALQNQIKEKEINRKTEEIKKEQTKYMSLLKEMIQNTKEKDEDILKELKKHH